MLGHGAGSENGSDIAGCEVIDIGSGLYFCLLLLDDLP